MKCFIIPVTIRATVMVTKVGSHKRKTFIRATTKYSCAWDIAYNTESIAV
jgi:hypothetical protein